MSAPETLFEKIWNAHLVRAESAAAPAMLYVDLHLVHEVTSPQAFAELRARGLRVRRPERVLATFDHSTPTLPPELPDWLVDWLFAFAVSPLADGFVWPVVVPDVFELLFI